MSSYSELIKNFEKIRAYMRSSIFMALRAVTIIARKAPVHMMTSAAKLKAGSEIILAS